MPDGHAERAGRWLPLREAGPRLGLAPDSIRKRIRRGRWPAERLRRTNTGAWEVFVPDVPDAAPDKPAGRRTDMPDPSGTVAELRARVAGLEAVVAAQERHMGDLRAELERRRWPGLWPWLRRVLWGEG